MDFSSEPKPMHLSCSKLILAGKEDKKKSSMPPNLQRDGYPQSMQTLDGADLAFRDCSTGACCAMLIDINITISFAL